MLNGSLDLRPNDVSDAMGFLNDVIAKYPAAVSFAPGRPADKSLNVPGALSAISSYIAYRANEGGITEREVQTSLGQYGHTAGVIRDMLAIHLEKDEGILCRSTDVIVTNGAQEAMSVALLSLFTDPSQTLIVMDPTYVGITGLARLLGISLTTVGASSSGVFSSRDLEEVLTGLLRTGRKARAIYIVPDFSNPFGTSMSLSDRLVLLHLAKVHRLFILEDNPYRMYGYDGPSPPTLKSLDRNGCVLYLGTFSKTLLPGLRIGYMIASDLPANVVTTMINVKSLLSVNSSPLMQAAVGGLLVEQAFSLKALIRPAVDLCRQKRDLLIDGLTAEFEVESRGGYLAWTKPSGGYFLTLTLPFEVTLADAFESASRFGVIICPIEVFCVAPRPCNQVRLAFSHIELHEISLGVSRLAAFVRNRLGER